jgi:hypothetical protein
LKIGMHNLNNFIFLEMEDKKFSLTTISWRYIYTYIYTYIHTHTYIHSYMHTCLHTYKAILILV